MSSLTWKKSDNTTVISSFSYGYSDDNQKTSCTEANSDVVSWGYDGAGRLTSESRTGSNSYSKSYTLDGVGNRTSQTVGGTTTSFTLSAEDAVTATSGGFSNSYSYDAAGRQTSRTVGGTTYALTWDRLDRLTDISTGGSSVVSYSWDSSGRVGTRTAGGTLVSYVSGLTGVLDEFTAGGTQAEYTMGPAGMMRRNGEFSLSDGLGSERTVINSSQTTTGTINHDAFGQTVNTTGSSSNPYMYNGDWGYRNDGDPGLMQVGARFYDAQIGRFISRDTKLNQNPYLYCEHEPVNCADPSGHGPDNVMYDAGYGYSVGPNGGTIIYLPPTYPEKPPLAWGAVVTVISYAVIIGVAAEVAPAAGGTIIGDLIIGAISGGGSAGAGAFAIGADPGPPAFWGAIIGGGTGPITGTKPSPGFEKLLNSTFKLRLAYRRAVRFMQTSCLGVCTVGTV